MAPRLDILDYSIRGNPCDADSDALLRAAARKLGFDATVRPLTREGPPDGVAERVWLRYDLRSPAELRWLVGLARSLEAQGRRVFPSPRAILLCEDKWEGYRALADAGVPVVATHRIEDLERCGFPAVVKPRVGWGGMEMAVVQEATDVAPAARDQPGEYVCQPFIRHERTWAVAAAAGREIATIEKRASAGDFRTNERCGGTARVVAAPPGAARRAARALEAVGLLAGTVDLIKAGGGLEVLEINSAPGLRYPSLPGLDITTPMVERVAARMDRSP